MTHCFLEAHYDVTTDFCCVEIWMVRPHPRREYDLGTGCTCAVDPWEKRNPSSLKFLVAIGAYRDASR